MINVNIGKIKLENREFGTSLRLPEKQKGLSDISSLAQLAVLNFALF